MIWSDSLLFRGRVVVGASAVHKVGIVRAPIPTFPREGKEYEGGE